MNKFKDYVQKMIIKEDGSIKVFYKDGVTQEIDEGGNQILTNCKAHGKLKRNQLKDE